MASMRDAQQLVEELRNRANELHSEFTDGEVDFKKIVQLSDEVGAAADRVATTFQRVNDAFEGQEGDGDGSVQELTEALSPARARQGSQADVSREELYERAKKADIPGRSEMSKEELVDALEKAGAKV
jgi:ABC-type transporter Mla subunit MlaD